MKLTVVLAILIGTLVLACSSAAPAPAEPTPNIDATVEARVAQERAVDATVEARLKEERASQPTVQAQPTNTQAPNPTNTPVPQRINTPKPTPTNTPMLVPTATSVPTPTPRPIPTPTPVSYWCDGKTIRFKIGSVWANETIVFEQGGASQLNLTASSAKLPTMNVTNWPISASAQNVPPHIVVGNVSASDHTLISAWADGVQVATAVAIGGSYSMTIENQDCLVIIATPTPGFPTPTPTPIPPPTPIPANMYQGCSFEDTMGGWGVVWVGSVNDDNYSTVNDGTYVSAWIGSIEMARTQVSGGEYSILVYVCRDTREFNSKGVTVKFSIGGYWAEQTAILEGSAWILNLNQTNDPVVIN